jgi:hypothetical protein
MALHEVVPYVEEGLPVVMMDCSFIMHVIVEACKTHEIIWRTIGLKKEH